MAMLFPTHVVAAEHHRPLRIPYMRARREDALVGVDEAVANEWFAMVSAGGGVVRGCLVENIFVAPFGTFVPRRRLSLEQRSPRIVQLCPREKRPIDSNDAVRIRPVQHVHTLPVGENRVAVFAPLPLTNLHRQVLLVALRRKHDAMVLVHFQKRRVDLGRRRWERERALLLLSSRVKPRIRQVRQTRRARFFFGPRRPRLVGEGMRRPYLAVSGHFTHETFAMLWELSVLKA
mmetsp:Transcript_87622/g.246114  ORF Transcript_87622/g.246114 Transcript_87622/m.246114 type:complete len:233 (+) Transcript_87622:327-1025(+)